MEGEPDRERDDADALASTIDSGATQPETAADLVPGPGSQVGRFTLDALLGAGGMGMVFAANDPVLDRRIAIKLIRGSSGNAEARLLREAQAMARLKHPNVVTVYEAGVIANSVYIAMELVDGTNLREWLGKARGWRAIVATFIAAGRGLAAAHQADLVHRDFKPANVLLDGLGHVKVGDFGLVGVVGDEVARAGSTPSLDVSLTETGAVLGTPAYMAPEQLLGGVIDARADQFAFCVSLWEAVYGEHPFGRGAEVVQAIAEGRRRPPSARHGEPAWLERALIRGLDPKPSARWPSMATLLDELERMPRRRRRIAIVVASAIAIGGAATAGAIAAGGDARVSCDMAGESSAAVWTPEARGSIVAGFEATKLAPARDTAVRVTAGIDRWVDRWRATRIDACHATHERGDQSAELLDKRTACLDRELATLGALVDALGHPDAKAVQSASSAVDALPAPEVCTASRVAGTAATDPATQAVERSIAGADIALQLRAADLVKRADLALELARRFGAPGPLARALAIHARATVGIDAARARAELDEAQTSAAAARDPGLEAEVLYTAIRVAAAHDSADRVNALVPAARAAIERAGSPAPLVRDLAAVEFYAAMKSKRMADARVACDRIIERALPDDRDRLAANCKCRLALGTRDPVEAVPRCGAALAETRRHFGEIHPDTEAAFHNLVSALDKAERYDEARTRIGELGTLVGKLYGERSSEMAAHLKLAASILSGQNRTADARRMLERALAILDEIAPGDSGRGGILLELARICQQLEDIPSAVRYAEQGRIAAERTLGSDNVEMATVWVLYATAIGADPAQRPRAVIACDKGIAIAEKAPAGSTWLLGSVLAECAALDAEWHRFREALPLAQRSLTILDEVGDPRVAGRDQYLIGTVLLQLGRLAEAETALLDARKRLSAISGEDDYLQKAERDLVDLRKRKR